ncbi:mono/diheme cytochrome c family protein [Limimaricola variabilis]|uniref:Mono/diheme cytochrome c family protein n=1 Tax=Limimaricola variabilis TaxID=1492771 RepID=A0ABR6HK00_9RHOB|nr:cytochrome c [Limimaricola variabilis]MBB3710756.1 mono/diheme cytochrome c family protein [Limimaricola variabilis]
MNKTIILGTAGVILAGGLLWIAATPDEEGMGGHSMTPPDTSEIPQGAPIMQVALPAALGDQVQMGKRAFDSVCADCHGANAAGKNGVAPPLVHKTYEPSHHGDYAFLAAVQNGVRSHHWDFGDMPPIEGLTEADVANVVAYVRALQRENGID